MEETVFELHIPRLGVATAAGAVGGTLAGLFGGWDGLLETLVLFMAADYLTGVFVAAFFQRSRKSASGALSSSAGLRGIAKKMGMLLLVLVGHRLDLVLGSDCLRQGVLFALLANEALSITENLSLMGVPLPPALAAAIDVLLQKGAAEKAERGRDSVQK